MDITELVSESLALLTLYFDLPDLHWVENELFDIVYRIAHRGTSGL